MDLWIQQMNAKNKMKNGSMENYGSINKNLKFLNN
jgi:hypothetical protein